MSEKTILVADDDPDIAEQLTLLLRAEGYAVIVAAGQEEAEQALLSTQPDLAVVDLMMEHHDSGFVLCREIKKLYPSTPVILLSSVKATVGVSFELASGDQPNWIKADRLLDKPVRPEQFKNEVRRLLAGVDKPGAECVAHK